MAEVFCQHGLLSRTPFELVAVQASHLLPQWAIFLSGLGLIIASFKLFDRALPKFERDDSRLQFIQKRIYRPWTMFMLGGAITLVSMSVSVSLGLLVPLRERGIVRARYLLPYILGANITTFVDTLVAAAMMDRGGAIAIVNVQMMAVAVVSALVLGIRYKVYERWVFAAVDAINGKRLYLVAFLILSLVLPFGLIMTGFTGP